MSCRDFVESLADFVSAEVEPAILERLDGHLAGCLCCAHYMESYLLCLRLARRVLLGESA
ncbi:MAG: hypothetical protein KJ067_18175 [Vicinamibacteria bacterium]|nr:hypothetical protein [Vicinamibacteria bacterium]